ncbi:DUF4142 domain-containing protein [Pigmentiphaga aceris]|uniref:DUF4142 domain-containing protein n=1 Tax=Pigmentiphaga aceris TaxID=1940612 RepID=A0A5C0B3P0_9BURK|nr:DUF4142 domain-containing protein [Pigmentiphaga aceris]QEI07401.1 DUF4142 domain-containing protein [Pigmentiphaga aceris]
MRYRTLAAAGLICLGVLSAPVSAQAPAGKTVASAPAGKQLGTSDKNFLDESLASGLAAVEASKLILTKTANPKIKTFAERMIKDQGALNDEIGALATLKGSTPVTEPSVLQRTQLKALGALEGEEADKMYVQQIGVISQQNNLLSFQNTSAKADDPEIKAFAKSRVSGFQDRLNMARALGKSDHGM